VSLRAAVASTDITPPVGVELCGYGFYLERASTGVLDSLSARALVLESGSERVAVVACDLLGVSRDLARTTRLLVQETTGIPPCCVMLACSHTHAGPATVPVRGCGEMSPGYVAGLPQRLADVVARAAEAVEPARLGFARGVAPGLGFNRVEGEVGPLDEELLLMAVQARDGSPLAVAYHATAHGVTHLSCNTLLSADWPGAASRLIAESGAGEALYLAGASGDVNPVLAHTGRGDEAGKLVADAAAALLRDIRYADEVTVGGAAEDIALPLERLPREALQALAEAARTRLAGPDTPETAAERNTARVDLEWAEQLVREDREGRARDVLVTEVQALHIGEGLLLAHGSELFCEYGQALKARFTPRPTFVVGYANDFIGYVPDPEDFARGGYAAATVPKICGYHPFASDVGSRLVAALTDVAGRVEA